MNLLLSDTVNIFIALIGAVSVFLSAYWWAVKRNLNSFLYFLICVLVFTQFAFKVLGEYKIFNPDVLIEINNIHVVPLGLYVLIFFLLILFSVRVFRKK